MLCILSYIGGLRCPKQLSKSQLATICNIHQNAVIDLFTSPALCSQELTDAPTWVVDPIDGTTNFIHRQVPRDQIAPFANDKSPTSANSISG